MLPSSAPRNQPRDGLREHPAPRPSQPPFGRRWGRIFSLPSSPSEQPVLIPLRSDQETAMGLFGLPVNPRFQSSSLTQIATDTNQPDQRRSELSRSGTADREKTTNGPLRGGTAEPSLSEPTKLPRPVFRDLQARARILENESRRLSESAHEFITENREPHELSQDEIVDLYGGELDERWHDIPHSPSEMASPDPPTPADEEALKENVDLVIGVEEVHDGCPSFQQGLARKGIQSNALSWAEQLDTLFASIPSILTPRGILFLKMLEPQQERAWGSQASSTPSGFDQRLTLDEAIGLAGALDVHPELLCEPAWLKGCDICHVPGFQGLRPPPIDEARISSSSPQSFHQARDVFNAFRSSPLGSTLCCSRKICGSCYAEALTKSIAADFWHDLGSPHWLRCTFRTCSSRLPIRHNVDHIGMLSNLQDPQAVDHVARQYEKASRYRDALEALEPRPTAADLQRAAELHTHLQLHGRIRDFLDPRQPLRARIEVVPVASADESKTLQVPIFVDLIIPTPASSNGRDCIVCAESLLDVTDGTPEEEARWAAAISDFPGDWAHLVRPFMPPSSLPACSARHALDVCRGCLDRHIAAQLESRGRGVSEFPLSCPSPGCGHVYTDSELRMVASPATFARYDQLRLLSYLATLPDFRWCLREGCHSGQVYAFPAAPLPSFPASLALRQRNRVLCEACGFAMCFAHQTPWHEGLDCIEYDAERGDPQLAATRAWIRQHTKACPGCEAPVEKGAGCFHMTCQVCRFEFCWECLADWNQIVTVHPLTHVRKYRRDKHAVGCYFRSENAPEATMVAGRTVREALM